MFSDLSHKCNTPEYSARLSCITGTAGVKHESQCTSRRHRAVRLTINRHTRDRRVRRDCLSLYAVLCLRVNKAEDWAVPPCCTFSACRPFVQQPFVEPAPDSLKLSTAEWAGRAAFFFIVTHPYSLLNTHRHAHTYVHIHTQACTHIRAHTHTGMHKGWSPASISWDNLPSWRFAIKHPSLPPFQPHNPTSSPPLNPSSPQALLPSHLLLRLIGPSVRSMWFPANFWEPWAASPNRNTHEDIPLLKETVSSAALPSFFKSPLDSSTHPGITRTNIHRWARDMQPFNTAMDMAVKMAVWPCVWQKQTKIVWERAYDRSRGKVCMGFTLWKREGDVSVNKKNRSYFFIETCIIIITS